MQKKLLKFFTIALSMQLLCSTNVFAISEIEELTKALQELTKTQKSPKDAFITGFTKCCGVVACCLSTYYLQRAITSAYRYYLKKNEPPKTPEEPVIEVPKAPEEPHRRAPTITIPITFEPHIQEHIDIITNYFKQGEEKIASQLPLTDEDIPVGIALHGPPGTGKTMFAKALLQKGIPLFEVAGIESKWIGETEANLRAIYEEAKNCINTTNAPFAVVFIDEADSYLAKRISSDLCSGERHVNRVVNEFLRLTDGLEETSKRIVTIVSTNRYESLDEAAIRAGRLTKKIEFTQINNTMARSILDAAFAQLNKKASPQLTEFLDKYFDTIQLSSAAEWATVPRVAYEYTILEKTSEIYIKHFLRAILSINPGHPQTTTLLKTINTLEKN